MKQPDPARVARLEKVAHLLDDQFRVPVIGYRVGWDSLLGLLPIGGDLATGAVSAWIVYEAAQLGLPKRTITRMAGNVGLDFVLGSIPLVGDLFDVAFKANRRNMNLLRKQIAGVNTGVAAGQHPGGGDANQQNPSAA